MKNKHKLGILTLGVLLLVVLVVTLVGQLSANVNGTQNNSSQSEMLGGLATFFGQESDFQANTQENSQQNSNPPNSNSTQPDPNYKNCPTCNGDKTVVTGVKTRAPIICDRCGGDGKIGESWGYIWCKFCEGDGRIEYPPQEIREKCPTCGGTGQVKA